MGEFAWIPLLFVVLMIVATIYIGIHATRGAKTASDLFVAGRSVSVFWNASAISGEYLSAASFLGIAGLVMKNGYDAIWYPVCYATGYLFLLLFIAGPLRRFGAYTIPDFAEGRFNSPLFRKIAVTFVLFIGFFYTMPQMKGAGITIAALLDKPYWVGIVLVGAVITFNVALGGMKGITLVQAFQYWAKLFAISIPAFIVMALYGNYSEHLAAISDKTKGVPKVTQETTLTLKGKKDAPSNTLILGTLSSTTLTFPKGALIAKISPSRKPLPGEDKLDYNGLNGLTPIESLVKQADGSYLVQPGTTLVATPASVTQGGKPVVLLGAGRAKTSVKIEFAKPTTIILPAGSFVPNAQDNKKWIDPFGTLTSKYGYPLLYTYSLIIALICGTAGLPHILVRFYTNPDGRAAKRTTLWVMGLLGAFYVFPPLWGVLGRVVLPSLYATTGTDQLLIKLPGVLQNHLLGAVLMGITSAGAFAAFMSTFSGLLVSMSGAVAHDIYGKIFRPNSTPEDRAQKFKIAAVFIGAISVGLGMLVEQFDIAMLVGWAFAIAAASYFPLLLLGSWWRGLTMPGAAAGMLTGGLLSLAAIVTSMCLDKKYLTFEVNPLLRSLMEQPAIWGVPLSLGIMVVVSLLTRKSIPSDISVKMLRLHAPEEMGFSRNYIEH